MRDDTVHVLESVLGVTRTPAKALPPGPVHAVTAHADDPALRVTSDGGATVLASHRTMRRLLTSAPHESDAPPAD